MTGDKNQDRSVEEAEARPTPILPGDMLDGCVLFISALNRQERVVYVVYAGRALVVKLTRRWDNCRRPGRVDIEVVPGNWQYSNVDYLCFQPTKCPMLDDLYKQLKADDE